MSQEGVFRLRVFAGNNHGGSRRSDGEAEIGALILPEGGKVVDAPERLGGQFNWPAAFEDFPDDIRREEGQRQDAADFPGVRSGRVGQFGWRPEGLRLTLRRCCVL